MAALGKTPGSGTQPVRVVAGRLGLDTSHLAQPRNFQPLKAVPTPFMNALKHGGQSGLSIAARWFLDRGYIVSVPLEPAPYDLITESDDGLKRVQVKTTRQVERSGRSVVRIARAIRDPAARRNSNGHRRTVPYSPDHVDYFFIVTPQTSFLIPIGVVSGQTYLVLDEKYAAFAV